MTDGKICTKCGIFKGLDEFYNAKKGKYGKGQRCKECFDEINKRNREKKKNGNEKCSVQNCGNDIHVKGLCNAHYLRLIRHGDPIIKKKETNIKLDFEVREDGCFNCVSHKTGSNGYPQVSHKKMPSPAHRKVYEEMFGEIPKGLVVRHKCDNKLCMNPEHLELGTPKDNSRDMVERGGSTKGERNAKSKLKEEDVFEIKKFLSTNKVNRKLVLEISNNYGVNVNTIYDIYYNKTWTHVKESDEQ